MATIEELAAYVQAAPEDTEYVQQCLDAAEDIISRHVGAHKVPAQVRDTAVLEVAANLYQRRTSRRDITHFGDANGLAPMSRPALDPLTPARPILAPWLGVGIA